MMKTNTTSARISLFAAVAFLVLFAAVHGLKADLDPSWHFVSEYSIGRFGGVMIAGFLTLAVSCLAAFVAIRPQVKTIPGKIGLGFLLLAGVALAAGVVFVMDPLTTPEDQITFSGKMHGLSAMVGIPGLPIAAILLSRRKPRSVRWTAHATWISLVLMDAILFTTLPRNGGKFGPEVPIGWPNRLLVVAYAAWLIALARHVLSEAGAAESATSMKAASTAQ